MSIYETGDLIAGRYRVVKPLSKGGMGAVYVAEQVSLGREVAIKVILAGRAGQEAKDRFEAEARGVCMLAHPNIITYHDYGHDEAGRPYLVMEFLPGYPGSQLLRGDAPPSLHDAIHVVGQLCSALQEAHDKGIVHRDLKWSNVMITPQSHDPLFTKLIDFGIMKVAPDGSSGDQRRELTMTGVLLGTPEYMSPEAICGKPVDGRSDQYALAVMVYELLCGRRPFRADSHLEVLRMHVQEPLPPMREAAAILARYPQLELVMGRALAKLPHERFASMLDFHDALLSATEQDGTTPASRPRRRTTARGRRRSSSMPTPAITANTTARAQRQLDRPRTSPSRTGRRATRGAVPEACDTGAPSASDVAGRAHGRRRRTPWYVWAVGAVAVMVAGFVGVLAIATQSGDASDDVAPPRAAAEITVDEAQAHGAAPEPAPAAREAAEAEAEAASGAPSGEQAPPADAEAAEAEAGEAEAEAAEAAEAASETASEASEAASAAPPEAPSEPAEARAPTRRPARAPRYGALTLTAIPFANVSIDGEAVGRTPLVGVKAKAGRVRVTFKHPTYGTQTRIVRLDSDERKKITIDMKAD